MISQAINPKARVRESEGERVRLYGGPWDGDEALIRKGVEEIALYSPTGIAPNWPAFPPDAPFQPARRTHVYARDPKRTGRFIHARTVA